MSFFTDHYKLYVPVAGEVFDSLEDSRRFLTIDRQLLGLMQVLGNGVVSGLEVSAAGGLVVAVSPGRANIFFMSVQTDDVRTITGLIPNATNYIYAQATSTTRFDRDARFFADVVQFGSGQQILLAAVTTNSSGVVSIDTSVRDDISFIEAIKDLINKHRHRGAPDNPSKIDLNAEVMGKLPGFHIAGLDADIIKSGRIPGARLPLLDHSELLNSGVLSHAQLDSFVRNLANPNVRLLGELSLTNLLQLYLAFKHIWNEVDSYSTNLLVVIPGITPNTFTDFNKSTAIIDTTNHLIQGVPSLGGELVSATYRTKADYSTAKLKSNIEISTDTTGDFFRLTKPFTESIIDSFDNVFETGTTVPNWTVETIAVNSTTTFKSDDTKKVDGPFSAKLDVDQQIRLQATRTFTTDLDWTAYNELEIHVETKSAAHGKIIFQILQKDRTTSVETELDSFTLLSANEVTTGFRKIVRDITTFDRSKISAIRIYTETGSLGWDLSTFILNVDRIRVNNNLFYSSSGRIRFRLKVPQRAHWAAISWDAELNGGTVQARGRSAPTYETFDQSNAAPFGSFFSESGGDPNVSDNRVFELEIAVTPNGGKTATPIVRSVTISYITSSTTSGLSIDTTEEFLRASKIENADIEDPGNVIIDGRVDVGDIIYGTQHSVQQVSIAEDSTGAAYQTPIVGLNGSRLPLSPLQVVSKNFTFKESTIDGAASVERLKDRTYLVADTLNDRVLVLDRNGNLLRGFASNNVRNVEELFPISVVYNRDSHTLYVAWSTNLALASIDLSKMVITGAGLSMTLSNSADRVTRIVGPNNDNQSSNVSPIVLSLAHAGQLEAFFGDASVVDQRLFISIGADAAKEGIDSDAASFAALQSPRGMEIFVGNLTFVRGLFRPISISRTAAETWLIANAKPLLTTEDGADPITGVGKDEVTSVIEIDPETGEILFSDNSVDFSLLTLGGVVEVNERYIAVGGIVEGEQPEEQVTTATITAKVGEGVIQKSTTETTSNQNAAGDTTTTSSDSKSDRDVLSSRRGVVKIIEKRSGRVVFDQETSDGTYAADIQLDEDGNIVTIEKSFGETSSSGRVIKMDEDGNIFYQFGLEDLSSPNDVRVLSTGNLIVST